MIPLVTTSLIRSSIIFPCFSSCNGLESCSNAKASISDGSCNSQDACKDAFFVGDAVLSGSCNGVSSCLESEALLIGSDSCNGERACEQAFDQGMPLLFLFFCCFHACARKVMFHIPPLTSYHPLFHHHHHFQVKLLEIIRAMALRLATIQRSILAQVS